MQQVQSVKKDKHMIILNFGIKQQFSGFGFVNGMIFMLSCGTSL